MSRLDRRAENLLRSIRRRGEGRAGASRFSQALGISLLPIASRTSRAASTLERSGQPLPDLHRKTPMARCTAVACPRRRQSEPFDPWCHQTEGLMGVVVVDLVV